MKLSRHTSKPKIECTGMEKPVPKGFVPITLYHVTTNIDKVCREGFREPEELGKEARKKHTQRVYGIGGATDNKISTTYSKALAEEYFQDVVTFSKIANGTLTPKKICSYLDKHDKTDKMKKTPCELWQSMNDIPDDFSSLGLYKGELNRLSEGKVLSQKSTFDIIENISKEDAVKWGLGDGDLDSRFNNFVKLSHEQRKTFNNYFLYEKASPEVIQERVERYWKYRYLTLRSVEGGRSNPAFVVGGQNYQKDPHKIGIVKLKGYLPKSLDTYLAYIKHHEWEYGNDRYDPYHGFLDEKQYEDKFKILLGESEIRLNPDWYNHLEIIKRGDGKSHQIKSKRKGT